MLAVFIISDGSGETASRVVRSALTQFAGTRVTLIRRARVRSAAEIRTALEEALAERAQRPVLIVHTLVTEELRRLILHEARTAGLDTLDLLGPLLERVAGHLQREPQETPRLFHQLAEARSREIEAVDFAFRHDDGQNAGDFQRAEIVLVGVSRAMKTPTMLHLAYHGWFTANVPLVPELPLPPALDSVPREWVFCLVMAPHRLQELRWTRAEQTNIPREPYTALDQIRRELLYARNLAARHGWRTVDTTGKSVEEVAREIIVLRGDDRRLP